jgi:hypothetical protein
MTVQEMHTAVLLGLDKSASFQVAAFEPEDIDYWLNEAQLELVKHKLFGNNHRKEDFNDSVKRMEDLTPLIKETPIIALEQGSYVNSYKIPISTVAVQYKYMFFLKAFCLLNTPGLPGNNTYNEAILISKNEIGSLIQSERNTPYLKQPYVYLEDNHIYILYDPYKDYDVVKITFVKYPDTLVRSAPGVNETNTSELPEQVHQEIVALAVSLMLENIESQRFQTQMVTLNK